MSEETDEKVSAEISNFSKLTKTGKSASPNWRGVADPLVRVVSVALEAGSGPLQ